MTLSTHLENTENLRCLKKRDFFFCTEGWCSASATKETVKDQNRAHLLLLREMADRYERAGPLVPGEGILPFPRDKYKAF